MQKFTDWLKKNSEVCGLCDPPLEPQKALNFLRDYLLGEDWYVTMPESTKQVNTAVVFKILLKYSEKFKKEYKEYLKIEKSEVKKEDKSTNSFEQVFLNDSYK